MIHGVRWHFVTYSRILLFIVGRISTGSKLWKNSVSKACCTSNDHVGEVTFRRAFSNSIVHYWSYQFQVMKEHAIQMGDATLISSRLFQLIYRLKIIWKNIFSKALYACTPDHACGVRWLIVYSHFLHLLQ